MRAVTPILPVSLLVFVASLSGQESPGVEPGARVRVATRAGVADPAWIVGTVATLTAEYFVVDPVDADPLAIPRGLLTRVEVSRGTRSKVGVGAGVGALVGAAASVAFLAMFCSGSDTVCQGDEWLRAFAIIAIPPTAVGALIGFAASSERWEPVPLDRLRVSLAMRPNRRWMLAGSVNF